MPRSRSCSRASAWAPLGLGVAGAVDVEWIRDPRFVEQLLLGLGREDLLPGMVALDRRQVSAAHEALGLVVEAHLLGGARKQLDQRPEKGRRPAHPGREAIGHVRVVAPEELIATLAGEHDLDGVRGQLRDQVCGERRGVAERLIERLNQAGQQVDRVGAQDQLVMVGAVALRDQPGVVELVEGALLEADGEGAHPVAALPRRHRGERRRVDAAGEKHADGHVRDQVRPDRIRGAGRGAPRRARRPPPSAPRRRGRASGRAKREIVTSPLSATRMWPAGSLRPSLKMVSGEGIELKERNDSSACWVDLAREPRLAEQRLELRGEGDHPVGDAVVERLDSESIASEQQPVLAGVPDRDREHAAQGFDERRPALLI